MPKPHHILVIRFSDIGDVAIAVPVLRCLIQQNQNTRVTAVTKKFLKPVLETVEGLEVVTADIRGEHRGLKGLLKFYSEIKDKKVEAIADLHGSLRSTVLRGLFSLKGIACVTIDKGRADKRKLTTGKEFKQLKTTAERYADVFREWGFHIDLTKHRFPQSPQPNKKILKLLGADSKKRIGIAPFAFFKSKMYPLDLMEELLEVLSKTDKYKLILFGGKKEESELERLSKTYKNTFATYKTLSFKEEINLISNLDLMVSMDSGNAHLAAMQNVKVITLWGVTHPYAGFAPFHQPQDYCLLANREKFPLIPTSVYGNKYPEGYEKAAGSIPVQKILEKIEEVMGS